MSTSMRFSIEEPGSGHNGSVDWLNATGNSHWKPQSTNLEVRHLSAYVMTLPMQAFRSSSTSESRSRGLGNSIVTHCWVVIFLLFKLFKAYSTLTCDCCCPRCAVLVINFI